MSPQVSVVIATYNYAHYLPLAIESCLKQTFSDLEVLVIDDGSIDDTPNVTQRFTIDGRVRYVRTSNAGQPAAENLGVRLSRGKFIAFLDADDLWLAPKIERQIEQFRCTPAAGVVYARRKVIDPEGHELQSVTQPCHHGHVLEQMFQNNFVCFSSCMVRREVFDDVGFFNEEYRHASDYEFWLRVAQRWIFEFVDEPLVLYRTGHANLTSHGERQLLTALRIMERFVASDRRVIPRSVRDRCFAETYCHLALSYRQSARVRALRAYLDALSVLPSCYAAWRGLATLFLPEMARRMCRRALGRPVDWRIHPKVAQAELRPSR